MICIKKISISCKYQFVDIKQILNKYLEMSHLLIENTYGKRKMSGECQPLLLVSYWSSKNLLLYPVNIYMFKVNNRNTGKRYGICSQLTIKPSDVVLVSLWLTLTIFSTFFSVSLFIQSLSFSLSNST